LGGVDLFSALTAMTVMGVAAVSLGAIAPGARSSQPAGPHQVRVEHLAAASITVVVMMHVTGIFVAAPHSYTRCMGWPIWRLIGSDLHPWLQYLRLGLSGVGAALVVSTAVMATRSERLRRWGIVLATLFASEMALGLVIRAGGINAGVAAAYSVVAVALLSCLGLLMAVASCGIVDTERPRLLVPTGVPGTESQGDGVL
jgi:cytochrome c oxidase assembly protein subunit 15